MKEHPAIEARGWGWRHAGRRRWAVRGLDLVVNAGERVLLLGPSGAGKSTLLAALAGLLRAPESGDEEGSLWVDGVPAGEAPSHAGPSHAGPSHAGPSHGSLAPSGLAPVGLAPVGLVFQDPSSALVMGRLGDEVAFGLENRAVPVAEIWPRVERALAAVGLRYPLWRSTEQLSGGEQQRLAIADVVATEPRLWLLDEPTANLDPLGAALVRATLRKLLGRPGHTLVLVEHRVEQALELVERVVVLGAEGAVVADGRPSEVFSRHARALRAAGVWAPGPAPMRLSPPRAAGRPVIAAADVSVRYQRSDQRSGAPAVEKANLVAYEGQVLAITGPNGSGKSSLALVLASLLAPSEGSVNFLAGGPAVPYTKWPARELVRWVGTVFQEPEHQFVASTVEGELLVGPRRAGVPSAAARRRVAELMERLRLQALARANPFTLSGGEKRRLSVATALATEPALLVLDEPTFGQDASTWDELVALLAEQREAGRAVICVTHDEQLVGALADREVQMSAGRLREVAGVWLNGQPAERPRGTAAVG